MGSLKREVYDQVIIIIICEQSLSGRLILADDLWACPRADKHQPVPRASTRLRSGYQNQAAMARIRIQWSTHRIRRMNCPIIFAEKGK
jgi:hypothetical protein